MKRLKPINSSAILKKPRLKKPARQTASELRELQQLMAHAVMRPLTGSERMRPRWSDGRSTKKIAASFIKPNSRLTSFERLEIYNRQYWLRVTECFYDDYAGLRAILGEGKFRDLAIAYLANHPSASFTLRDLGKHLTDFIKAEPRWTAPQQELALDMARLEWAHIEAFDNEALTPIAAADLEGCDAAKIYLRLQPHITLLKLAYPVDEFLISLHDEPALRGEASNAIADSQPPNDQVRATKKSRLPERHATRLAVHRHRNVVYYKRLTAAQFELLAALDKGASLAKALRTLPQSKKMPRVAEWFRNWASLGWFWSGKQKR